jgi:hypothetical protein
MCQIRPLMKHNALRKSADAIAKLLKQSKARSLQLTFGKEGIYQYPGDITPGKDNHLAFHSP